MRGAHVGSGRWYQTPEAFGEFVLERRRNQLPNPSQEDLARRIDVDQSQISKWESGKSSPKSIEAAASGYGLSEDEKANWYSLKLGTIKGTPQSSELSVLPLPDFLEYIETELDIKSMAIFSGTPEQVSEELEMVILPVLWGQFYELRKSTASRERYLTVLARAEYQLAESESMWQPREVVASQLSSIGKRLSVLASDTQFDYAQLLDRICQSAATYVLNDHNASYQRAIEAERIAARLRFIDLQHHYWIQSLLYLAAIRTNRFREAGLSRNRIKDISQADIAQVLRTDCLGSLARYESLTGSKEFWEEHDQVRAALRLPAGGYQDRYGAMRMLRRELEAMRLLNDPDRGRIEDIHKEAALVSGGQYERIHLEIIDLAKQIAQEFWPSSLDPLEESCT